MGKQGSFIKRFTDIVISIFTLLLTAPIILIAAIAIKLDSRGPVIFAHTRTGYRGKKFKMYKLRGMVDNALEIGPELTQENDPRITRVGKFLRRTSIDELPQFINVIKGDMSIIGPRPEAASITKYYTPDQQKIFKFKPGITGYSQTNGRQKLTPEQRVKMEINYYNQANFWSDLKIVIDTIKVIESNHGNI
ncbi:MAG TPA: sugar transferase [Ignavibacteriaceae bacterium]|nr:sugar transferase [Ignavibacteriaceae bacterium]